MNSFSRPGMPSLNALRAFEAAARHQSFVQAAHELNVTAGAVAQQIKQLEAWVGYPLFQRASQGVRLTAEAQAALPVLIRAFDLLSDGVRALRGAGHQTQIAIAALPAVAHLWLSPKLPQLSALFPGCFFSIAAMEEPPNFRREPFDLALFYVDRDVEGSRRIPLGKDELVPVCAPALLDGDRLPLEPARLRSMRLLHDSVWRDYWQRWLDAAGVPAVDASKGSEFSLYSLALQAAIGGAGVLMGRSALVREPLASGALVTPFATRVQAPGELCLLIPDRSLLLPRVDLLVDCLRV
ncbi:MAG: LysR family transcriptional regulator [Castellaniella sp.]|nr:LysR family transcriptional regulator [Castellaniella sp.]